MHELNVLIVEDDPLIRKAFGLILKDVLEARTFYAPENAAAFSILDSERIDLVFCDFVRPNGSTEELIHGARSRPGLSRLPFLICSGGISESSRLAMFELGHVCAIRKPTSQDEILRSIRKLVQLPEDRVINIIRLGRESQSVDYKETCDLTDFKARASLAKDMIAMAHSTGGSIVFGLAERTGGSFEVVGVSDKVLSQFEPTRFSDCLRAYVGDNLRFSIQPGVYRGKPVVGLFISPNDSLLFPKRECAEAKLFPGRIYAGTDSARSE